MAQKWLPIFPDDGSWPFKPEPTSFTQSFMDDVGNIGDSTDGWDEIVTGMASIVDPHISTIESLTDNVAASDFTAGDFHAQEVQPISDAHASASVAGDTLQATQTNTLHDYNAGQIEVPQPSTDNLPPGSWSQTCKGAFTEDGVLYATCERFDGNFQNTSIYYLDVVGDIVNINGVLTGTHTGTAPPGAILTAQAAVKPLTDPASRQALTVLIGGTNLEESQ